VCSSDLHDDFFPPDAAKALETRLRAMGKDVTLTVHPGTGHAFMAPHNALGTHNPAVAETIWPEVVAFLRTRL
jgi:carboxymethylenebutenolidase